VLAEGSKRVLEDPARITRLVEDAERLGASDLFVQLYRQGRSWYASKYADPSPFERIRRPGEEEPLRLLVREAHARGVRVHAWFNTLMVHGNRNAPVLREVGPSAALVDRQGRSLLDYPRQDVPPPLREFMRLGSPGIWLDPAVPGVIESLEGALDDLVAAEPELDGLHLDFVRHPLALPIVPGSRFAPGLDFGYGADAKERFSRESGRAFARGDAWDEFRRARVTELVQRLGARLPERWEYSAAVLPWADRAYLSAMQDWRGWLDEGLLDFVVAMAYMRDDRLLRYVAQGLRGGVGGDRVWIGLGTWLFASAPERIAAQVDIALQTRPPGVVFFSYDAVADEPAALAALLPTPAVGSTVE
jgi:uncharacterized lipoprotein YddW (UPF0748 family)